MLAVWGVLVSIVVADAVVALSIALAAYWFTGDGAIAELFGFGALVASHWLIGLALGRWTDLRLERDQKLRIEAIERYSHWTCPTCRQAFGGDVFFVNYDRDHQLEIQGRVFTRHVVIHCPHCRLLNVFDPNGNAMTERGEFFEPVLRTT